MRRIITCVTIDTEPDSDYKWSKITPRTFKSVEIGIKDVLRPIFSNYNIKPVYFISPGVAGSRLCRDILLRELDKGSEIGNHLHADEMGRTGKGYACYDLSGEDEGRLIYEAHELIKNNFDVAPLSYRGGRFGTDMETLLSIQRLGYHVDSSVTPNIDWSGKGGPNFIGFPDQPYFIDLGNGSFNGSCARSKMLEVPVTVGKRRLRVLPARWYFFRWLRPSHMSALEMKILLREFMKRVSDKGPLVFCMMFHSIEVIPKASPYVRNAVQQKYFLRRLKTIIEYLKSIGSEFMTLEEIYREYSIEKS